MIVLGLNTYHPDAAVALFKDGRLIWAAEEERYARIKHISGFPEIAIKKCLEENKLSISDIDFVVMGKDPLAHLPRKILFTAMYRPSSLLVSNRLFALKKSSGFKTDFCRVFNVLPGQVRAKFMHVEHHAAHAASAFFVSGFKEAAFVTIDGLGDFVSTSWGTGEKNKIKIEDRVFFPHSAGFLYTAGTQFLGFDGFGDEYKVMGLASYGKPVYLNEFREMYRLLPGGRFKLILDFFRHHKGQAKIKWVSGKPEQDILFSSKWEIFFGAARVKNFEVTQFEKDIAASLQAALEEIYFHVLKNVHAQTGSDNLCLAGGVAFNCVANGKIQAKTPFKNVFIQPAAGDAGTAIGAAAYVAHSKANASNDFVMQHAFLGSQYDNDKILETLTAAGIQFEKYEEEALLERVAGYLDKGKVVGWYQGSMEFGPRALGNRSILADARIGNIRDVLNLKIKRRELFRPFAPIVLKEEAQQYFNMDSIESPFMLKVFPVKEDKKKVIPAVTHIDGSARVQTVSRENNELLWKLLKAFEKKTGVPVLLNTSFNEHEPIVCTPREALDCYLKTKMDVLVLGSFIVSRND